MDFDTQQELQRLEDDLLRFCPSRSWEVKTVTFPSTANVDLDIATSLQPYNPECVGVQVLQASQPCFVWKDTSGTRTAWTRGIIRVRCTAPSASVVLLLSTQASPQESGINNTPHEFSVGPSTALATLNGLTGSSTFAGETWLGPGVKFGTRFDMGLNDNGGTDFALMFSDRTNGYTPLMLRRFSGNYYVQPGYTSRGAGQAMSLGNPNDSFNGGWFDNAYVFNGYYEAGRTTKMGHWASFTPTWTNLTVGNGTVTAKYSQVGKTTYVEVLLVFGTTTAVTGGVSIASLPTSNMALAVAHQLGYISMYDSSAAKVYPGIALSGGATTASLQSSASPVAPVTATVPYTWAVSDQLYIMLAYQNT
jgi:hypothetical protein